MSDFFRGLMCIKGEYHYTFAFYKRGIFKFLKCISIMISIIPATIFALLTLICAGINIVISKALIIGLIWSIVVCGILN